MDGSPKILLVEDNEKLRSLYSLFLHEAGYDVSTAADGEEALQIAKDYVPDLIFLDIMLPKVNGLEVLQKLRHDSSYNCQKTKIVLLTNLGDTGKIDPKLHEDADGYAMKSEISLKDLIEIIKSFHFEKK